MYGGVAGWLAGTKRKLESADAQDDFETEAPCYGKCFSNCKSGLAKKQGKKS